MATYREQDPLAVFLTGEQNRLLDCIKQFANGGGAASITEARRIIHALAEAESTILYPAFSKVRMQLETERMLEDSRDNRAQQLAALEVLARKRAVPLRKLVAVELCDLIAHQGEQHTALLIPVLASQLPRPVYRSMGHQFMARVAGELEHAIPTKKAKTDAFVTG